MRGIAIAGLLLCACPGSSPPPPIERATPVAREVPVDAAVEVAAVTPDAAIVDEPKRSPLDELPPSGEDPLPENATDEDILVRYLLAVEHAGEPLGLALLLDIANAVGGVGNLDGARYDDTWASQWDQPAFQLIVTMGAREPRDGMAPLDCPAGTKPKHSKTYYDWCQRPNGVKHGPYRYREEGYDLSEGVAEEWGDYTDGKKTGLWFASESFSGWSRGAYVGGKQHGLWEIGERETYAYVAFVDGKEHGLVTTKAPDGMNEDVTIGEHRYDHGVLHGEFREWKTEAPFAIVAEGAYDHGKKSGEWRTYDDDGAVRSIAHWDAGVPHGDYAFFNEQGDVLAQGALDHGTGDWIELDTRGLRAQGALVKGVKEGKWGERDELGEAWDTGEYVHGDREGPWVTYTTFAGDTLVTGAYARGKKTGEWRYATGTGHFAKGIATGRWELTGANGTQVLELKHGKLVKIDGKKPTKAEQEAFASWSADDPSPIYPADPDVSY